MTTSPSKSIEEVVDTFSQEIPEWQRKVNIAWLTNLHSMMAEGAVWGSPGLGTVYQKQGDGFIPVLLPGEFSDNSPN